MLALVGVACAFPQGQVLEEEPIQILVDDRVQPEGGNYAFNIQTENGIVHSEQGVPGAEGQSNVQGSYSFPQEDGSVVEVRYIANEYGFQVDHPLLPVAPENPHPLPQFVLDQIAFGEEQRRLRAQGQAPAGPAVNIQQQVRLQAQVPVPAAPAEIIEEQPRIEVEVAAPAVNTEEQLSLQIQEPLPLQQ